MNDNYNLILKCNINRQEFLLKCHFVENEEVTKFVECEDDCDGWFINNRRCECGYNKNLVWDTDGYDLDDINIFNIESEEPLGQLTLS